LPSRDLITDSIEAVTLAQHCNGNISIPGCDKNMPGVSMATARHNMLTIIMYGGIIQVGTRHVNCPSMGYEKGGTVNISDAFKSYAGCLCCWPINNEERFLVVRHSCPGTGTCGGMYIANTISPALKVLGMSLPYFLSMPAMYPEKAQECFKVAKYMKHLLKLELDLKPRDILTCQSFLNAITIVNALSGSMNAVLHLLAVVQAVDVPLTIDNFQMVSDRTPYLADLRPFSKYHTEDIHKISGIPAIIKYLLKNTDLIDGSQMTITGKTLAEDLMDVSELNFDNQDVIKRLDNPIKLSGHYTILKGSLAPGTTVAKLTEKEGLCFEGTAKCFDSVHDFCPVLERGNIKPGMVLIFRYQGLKGGPGMPEVRYCPTATLISAGWATQLH
ncbi:dihydroxy-acid and 6-phosphogluconate dehydratase, partial [Suillus decipiens]